MTAAAIPASIVPPHPVWRSLLWLIPLTVLWIVLISWQPSIWASGAQTTTHQLMAHAVIGLGLWLGLETTDLTSNQRRTTWLAVMIPYTLWFAAAWSTAINGVFITGASPFPFLPLAIFLPVIVGAPLLLLSKRVGQVLDAMPGGLARCAAGLPRIRWLGSGRVAARGTARRVRVAGGNWRCTDRPVRCAGGDRRGDRFGSGPKGCDTLEYLRPGRLRRSRHLGDAYRARPVRIDCSECGEHQRRRLSGVLTPAFVVPSSILLHALSLRQLRRRGRWEAARR